MKEQEKCPEKRPKCNEGKQFTKYRVQNNGYMESQGI